VVCEAVGAAFVGANCSTGAEAMVPVLAAMSTVASGPWWPRRTPGCLRSSGDRWSIARRPSTLRRSRSRSSQRGVRLIAAAAARRRSSSPRCAGVWTLLAARSSPPQPGRWSRRPSRSRRWRPVSRSAISDPTRPRQGTAPSWRTRAGAGRGRSALPAHRLRRQRGPLGSAGAGRRPCAVRAPALVLSAASGEFLEALLRRYPGRPGVVGASLHGAIAIAPQALAACRKIRGVGA